MDTHTIFQKPRWLKDFLRFLPLKSQFVLTGNIRDLQAAEVKISTTQAMITPQTLTEVVKETLYEEEYQSVICWDPVKGFQSLKPLVANDEISSSVLAKLGLTPNEQGIACGGLDVLSNVLERVVTHTDEHIALVVDFASRLVVQNASLSVAEHQLFTRAQVLSHLAKARPSIHSRKPLFSTVIWVVDKEGDVPDWFLINNPKVRSIAVSKPDHQMRAALIPGLLKIIPDYSQASEAEIEQAINQFVEQTDDLLLSDLNAIVQLARMESVPLVNITDAVRRYKVGVTEDPWQKINRDKIKNADQFIKQRVKGQEHATVHMLDIIKRAITGVGGSRRGNRPRGVVFLAGPTGVGKTELAKTMTSLLFGNEDAYIRFDMSEFSSEHSDQRLLGAPPGYIGYDVGGELTNAIREKPFSVVLFDEIEKAHPRILDKFLQILDDGVLTSGRGDRVYFSEALIVFTSNLGIYRQGEMGERILNVTSAEDFSCVQTKVLTEIERYFKQILNRPELLNRIGENIIVFDFIRAEIASEIFEHMLNNIFSDLAAQQGIVIEITEQAKDSLRSFCLADLSNGGRGIRNQLEAHLLNPLARKLFDTGIQSGQKICIVRQMSQDIELKIIE